jgi:serine/threonine-protein kinase
VIDISNNLLRIYNATTGTPSTTMPTLPTTGSPYGVAVDSAFNVYVTDSLNKQVNIYNSAGFQSKFLSTNWVPYGIAVDAHNNVYVTDITNSQVHIFNSSGSETVPPSPLTIAGYAYGVAVNPSGSNVFVSDYAGSLVLQYGISGTSPITLSSNPLYAPYGVAVDNVGNVYVTDLTNNLLHKYSSSL